ncbi:hypothetical protein B0H19DRAFT_1182297 [Mycena capillaripes]|nr:hypothetical protein B0H19DRAFT_1182297 [Mycena capillaripes]
MCRFSILDLAPATDPKTDPAAEPVKPDFESGEHEDIGNSVWLKFDTDTILGKDFKFKVGKSTLTYGLIVALAGDFYGNYTALPGDVEQISDNWDTNPHSSIAIGLKVAKWLSDDTEGYLAAVLTTMNKEKGEVFDRLKNGAEDVAQLWREVRQTIQRRH